MQRVLIFGCAGSGKSTLARRLGALIGAPVVHMDRLFWNPGWKQCEDEEFRRRTIAAHGGEAWVSDGNYSTKTWDIRVPRADTIVWLIQPRLRCLSRALWRLARNYGREREDLGVDCPEQIDRETGAFLAFIWNYETHSRPRHEAHLKTLAPHAPVHCLRGDRAVESFLRACAPPVAQAA